jgi:hypothetical protein
MRIAVVAVAVAIAAACASMAQAELTARGDLFVRFSGGIAPGALPRNFRAPISVHIAGTVKTLSGQRPPALRKIKVALNRTGRLDTTGLPVCRRDEIEPSSTQQALSICGDALVGGGFYAAEIAYPEQAAYASRGHILAFNSVVGGQRAILAQIYATKPVPITLIIVFHIRQPGGTFGTVLSGSIPDKVIRWGYLKQISLDLQRNFVYQGRQRSYLSAACEAPDGFPGATFPFAHASMTFADGRELSSTLTRSCKVRAGR